MADPTVTKVKDLQHPFVRPNDAQAVRGGRGETEIMRQAATVGATLSRQRRAAARSRWTFKDDGPDIRHPGLEDRTLSKPIQNTPDQELGNNGSVCVRMTHTPSGAGGPRGGSWKSGVEGAPLLAHRRPGGCPGRSPGKNDVPDIRNTRVIDIYRELESYDVDVSCYDPQADVAEVQHEYGIELLAEAPQKGPFDAVILAVKHRALLAAYPREKLQSLGGSRPLVVIDVKGFLARGQTHTGATVWQL